VSNFIEVLEHATMHTVKGEKYDANYLFPWNIPSFSSFDKKQKNSTCGVR
jgi:hypothetical protein